MDFLIEYCRLWNYKPDALRVKDLLKQKADKAEIEPGRVGALEISRDGSLVFSKLDIGRFPTDEEVLNFLGLS